MANNNVPGLSDRELVAHLERLTGRQIRSREDIADYVVEIQRRARDRRTKGQHLKNALLVALLLAAAGQYYFIDVQLQILAQPTLTVFVPAKSDAPPKRPYI